MKSFKQYLGEDLRQWFKQKWVRMDTKGNIKGDCAREPGEGKPKCLPQAKAHAIGKEARASAARRKRREDPNPERRGAPINVKTESVFEACWRGYVARGMKKKGDRMVPNCVPEETVEEKWTDKYKRSIDCNNPKGFSQKAHCQGRKKNEELDIPVLEGEEEWSMRVIDEDESRIPKKPGQPDKSDKHSDLYTDEDPKGTIHGLKFATVDDAKESVSKIKNSSRSHAHKIQAAVAMEQRAREMGKSSAAAVYRRYINLMKDKTERMNEDGVVGGSAGPTNVTGVATSTDPISATAVNRKKRKSPVMMSIRRKPPKA
jgi:hypothetical protein